MAIASGFYVASERDMMKNVIAVDYSSLLNKIALYVSALTPNFNADPSSYSTTNEASGTGYTAGGLVIANPVFTISSGNLNYDLDDLSWPGSTITAGGCTMYANALAPKANLWTLSFGGDFNTVAGTYTIQWNPSGVWSRDLVP